MSVPFTFDVHSERDAANKMLAHLGLTQAVMAARQANRGDASKGLTGIGDSGSVSQNPMAIGPVPAPPHVEANPAPPATVAVPPKDSNPMRVSSTPSNYVQPNVSNPKANPAGTVSRSNPMGL